MAKTPTTPKTYSPREIGAALNNALLFASQPDDFVIRESRLRRLSEYAQAVVQPCIEHVEKGLLSYQELVVALLSCALLTQAQHAVGVDKLPLVNLAKNIQKKDK